LPGETTKAAIAYLKQKAKIVAEKYDQRIQNAVRLTLLTGLKTGDSSGEIIARVNEALDREDSAYAETVVRTNVTDAVNTARLAEFRDPDMSFFIAAVKYSSILDDRTTPVCEHLHDKLFRVDDSALDEFTPPNHFNCRAVLVPVMIDEQPTPDEFITESEKGRARDLAGEGFL
jgi:SPP1 gp7 family putative phage head morphogenesis protein